MIRFSIRNHRYAVVESKEDFLAHWDEKWKRFDDCSTCGFNKNSAFPIIIRLFPSWDAHFCDSWEKADDEALKIAEKDINEAIDEHEKKIDELKKIRKTFFEG